MYNREKVVMTSLMFTFFPKMCNISNIIGRNCAHNKVVDIFPKIDVILWYNREVVPNILVLDILPEIELVLWYHRRWKCGAHFLSGHFTVKWGIFSVYWEVMCPRHFSSGHFYAFSVICYLYSENWMHLKYVRIFDVFSM